MAEFYCKNDDEMVAIPDALVVSNADGVRRVYRMIAAGEDRLEILREFYALFADVDGAPPLHMPETVLRLAKAYTEEAAHG
jgi:hypothetical protein